MDEWVVGRWTTRGFNAHARVSIVSIRTTGEGQDGAQGAAPRAPPLKWTDGRMEGRGGKGAAAATFVVFDEIRMVVVKRSWASPGVAFPSFPLSVRLSVLSRQF